LDCQKLQIIARSLWLTCSLMDKIAGSNRMNRLTLDGPWGRPDLASPCGDEHIVVDRDLKRSARPSPTADAEPDRQ
ncbi:hypothetical protein, partial [Phenylobacterium sp.]|uniref:hypothetical protein n=1 Tax=Phenylobacterium sp. TaxID=1871053 RepID=UPI0035B3D4B3